MFLVPCVCHPIHQQSPHDCQSTDSAQAPALGISWWSASWNRLWSARCRDVGGDLRSSDAAIVRPWAMAWAALSGSMLVQCLSPSCAHCQMTRVATSCRCCVVAVAVAERSLAFQFSLPMHADRDRRWTRPPLSMRHRCGTWPQSTVVPMLFERPGRRRTVLATMWVVLLSHCKRLTLRPCAARKEAMPPHIVHRPDHSPVHSIVCTVLRHKTVSSVLVHGD